MNIKFRLLKPSESKKYRTIRLESLKNFPEAFETDYHDALNTEKLKIESDIENQTPGRFVSGAFDDEELIGICVFVDDENRTGHLYQMYVKQNYQGKGIAQNLMKAVMNEAVRQFNTNEVILEVTHKNDKAYHLYKKMGFKKVDQNTNDFSITMKYNLDQENSKL